MFHPSFRRGSLLVLAVVAFAACEEVRVTVVDADRIEISPADATVLVNATIRLAATVYGSGGEELQERAVEWTSLDPVVATVDGAGTVTGVAPGSATIRARVGGTTASAGVTVVQGPVISLSPTSVSFDAVRNGPRPPDHPVSITNGGGGTLGGLSRTIRYAAGQPTGWLSASLSSTTAPATLVLRADQSGLTAGTYDAAVDVSSAQAGNSPQSVHVRLVVEAPPLLAPNAPTNLQATPISDSRIDLAWTHSGVLPLDHFEIQRARGSGSFSTIHTTPDGSVRTYADRGLDDETTYHYRVRACNVAGCSAWSATATARTPDDDDGGPPGTPSDVVATAASAMRIDVTWTAPGRQSHYEVRRRTGTGGAWTFTTSVGGSEVVYIDTGLNSGTTYQYQVRACNAGGCSDYSSVATATTRGN
jgi:hypothetical protein